MNILDEFWRDVPGFEGYYQVSDRGNVRSCDRMAGLGFGCDRFIEGQIIRFWVGRYSHVNMSRDGAKKTFRVHQLVMLAFVGDCPDGYEINHKNGDRHDNRLENLEYCTPKQNVQHAFALGLCSNRNYVKGSRQGQSKLVEADIPIIRTRLANGESQIAIARDYGVSRTAISDIRSGRNWKHVP